MDQAELQERRSEVFYLRAREQYSAATGRLLSRASRRDSDRGEHSTRRTTAQRGEAANNSLGTRGLLMTESAMNAGVWAISHAYAPPGKAVRTPGTTSKERTPMRNNGDPQGHHLRNHGTLNGEERPAVGKQIGDGSGDSSFHLSLPLNAVDYHLVKVDVWRGAPTIQATVSGVQRLFIVDTGSNVSLIKPGVSRSEIRATNLAPFGVTGNELEVTGVQEVEFSSNNRNYRHQFCVCSLPTDAGGIIGMDFLGIVNAKLDLEKQELRLLKYVHVDHDPLTESAREASGNANRLALTVFAASNGQESGQERKLKVWNGSDRPREEYRQHPLNVSLQEAESWTVKTTETI